MNQQEFLTWLGGDERKAAYFSEYADEILRLRAVGVDTETKSFAEEVYVRRRVTMPDGIALDLIGSTFNVFRLRGVIALVTFQFSLDGKTPVVFHDVFFECLSEEARRFVLLHEMGHVYYGHILQLSEEDFANGVTIPDEPISHEIECEYQADSYAATIMGLEAAVSALGEVRALMEQIPWLCGSDLSEMDLRLDYLEQGKWEEIPA